MERKKCEEPAALCDNAVQTLTRCSAAQTSTSTQRGTFIAQDFVARARDQRGEGRHMRVSGSQAPAPSGSIRGSGRGEKERSSWCWCQHQHQCPGHFLGNILISCLCGLKSGGPAWHLNARHKKKACLAVDHDCSEKRRRTVHRAEYVCAPHLCKKWKKNCDFHQRVVLGRSGR